MKTSSDCAQDRKCHTSSVAPQERVLDEEAFQQLLAAAYVLQEHTKGSPEIEAKPERGKKIPDPLIEPHVAKPPAREQVQVGRAGEAQIRIRGRQIRIILSLPSKRIRQVAKSSALPGLILLIIIVFLLSLPWKHYPADIVAEAASKSTVLPAARPLKPDTAFPAKLATTSDNPPTDAASLRSSHLRITDPEIASVVDDLSRYEMKTLRRQAEYGDDAAAMVLGMAYEIGRYVPQDCSKAAYWVAVAAAEGNAAAQYNLGLRHLYGDGISTNVQEGKQWLEKAAAHHYSKAESAVQESSGLQPN